MKISHIAIERSLLDVGAWKFELEINQCRFEGHFDDFGGFITMITEAAKFFSVRAGLLRVTDARFTREVAPGRMGDEMILPGDKH
ncbi:MULTISPECIES: hypothetical protein [Paraburkholderia]|uniref:hypothetical protein n=1 Tax=Paraburkholderia TaxID=1822464 RepID=UPI0022593B91|nr:MULTISPECIES: hypothetical protein [Paraburkholderia]MCX4154983.1 hypothetical protein [Paraburkholderia aspalathi]MDN7164393.1 hypothetical protein [Paraburkholderia sp. SECH2]MDQ6392878.1 hypothetical protein [Paraburkholderia aspalathi]